MSKSNHVKANFRPGSSRNTRSVHTLLRQMAQDAEKLSAQGSRIRQLRQAMRTEEGKRITQPVVADAVGVTPRAYQEWEAGRGDIKPENAKALADYFGTTQEYIEYGDRVAEKRETPDLLLAPEGSQLDRIEQKLDAILNKLIPSTEERLDLLEQVLVAAAEANRRASERAARDRPARGHLGVVGGGDAG